jgi:hypothetical protein
MATATDPRALYSEELASEVLQKIALGASLRQIAAIDGMPGIDTIFKWIYTRKDFAERYAHAKTECAELLADEIVGIADDGGGDYKVDKDGKPYFDGENVQRSKLRVEARKWVASKLKPKIYGEATLLKHADADGNMIFRVEDARQRVSPGKVIDIPPAEQSE